MQCLLDKRIFGGYNIITNVVRAEDGHDEATQPYIDTRVKRANSNYYLPPPKKVRIEGQEEPGNPTSTRPGAGSTGPSSPMHHRFPPSPPHWDSWESPRPHQIGPLTPQGYTKFFWQECEDDEDEACPLTWRFELRKDDLRTNIAAGTSVETAIPAEANLFRSRDIGEERPAQSLLPLGGDLLLASLAPPLPALQHPPQDTQGATPSQTNFGMPAHQEDKPFWPRHIAALHPEWVHFEYQVHPPSPDHWQGDYCRTPP
jgi:hypothetical protein